MIVMKVRTVITEKMFNIMLLFVVFILCPITFSEAVVEDLTENAVQPPCESKCGCEEMYIYDAVNDRCMINFKKAMKKVVVVYESNNVELLADDEMATARLGKNFHNCRAETIYREGENLFKGIMISVILFMTCAAVCVASACIYCCRINYTDRVLKKNVKALAKKLKRDFNSKKKMPTKRGPTPPMSESCSVVVEPAGVFVA